MDGKTNPFFLDPNAGQILQFRMDIAMCAAKILAACFAQYDRFPISLRTVRTNVADTFDSDQSLETL